MFAVVSSSACGWKGQPGGLKTKISQNKLLMQLIPRHTSWLFCEGRPLVALTLLLNGR